VAKSKPADVMRWKAASSSLPIELEQLVAEGGFEPPTKGL
jgi:hypothetical protein